ncbi:MAG: hypothetical protein JO339_33730 [Alphaproteobacteria bacterium]|nr:hypothetical protein [Alphaproteobacteria bacterium]
MALETALYDDYHLERMMGANIADLYPEHYALMRERLTNVIAQQVTMHQMCLSRTVLASIGATVAAWLPFCYGEAPEGGQAVGASRDLASTRRFPTFAEPTSTDRHVKWRRPSGARPFARG